MLKSATRDVERDDSHNGNGHRKNKPNRPCWFAPQIVENETKEPHRNALAPTGPAGHTLRRAVPVDRREGRRADGVVARIIDSMDNCGSAVRMMRHVFGD